MLLEIKPVSGRPTASPVYFSRIALERPGHATLELPLDESASDESRPSHLDQEGSSWGPPLEWQGRPSRALQNFGSSFHRVAGTLPVPQSAARGGVLTIDYWSDRAIELAVQAYWGKDSIVLGKLTATPHTWNSASFPIEESTAAAEVIAGINTSGMHGSGALIVHATRILNGEGVETHSFRHREPVTLELDYEIRDPELRERPQIVVALQRDGVQDVARWISRHLVLDRSRGARGRIRLHIPQLLLTDGQYSVTVLVAKEGYYDTPQVRFFSLNPDVYYCGSRLFDIVVRGSGLIGSGTVTVAHGEWSVVD
jgi:hypothetical protein